MRSPKTDVGVYMPLLLMPWEIFGPYKEKGTGKVEVTVTLEQATKAQRRSRGIALLFR
jgi:hypothetical protein